MPAVFERNIANNFVGAIASSETVVTVTGALNGITGYVSGTIQQQILRILNLDAQPGNIVGIFTTIPDGLVRFKGVIIQPAAPTAVLCTPGSITISVGAGCAQPNTQQYTFLGAAAQRFRLQIGDPGVGANDGFLLFFHEIDYKVTDLNIP